MSEIRIHTKPSDPQIKIRIPNDLKVLIEDSARKEGRSRVAEIIFRLRQAFMFANKE